MSETLSANDSQLLISGQRGSNSTCIVRRVTGLMTISAHFFGKRVHHAVGNQEINPVCGVEYFQTQST
jgi:hypothetical protein